MVEFSGIRHWVRVDIDIHIVATGAPEAGWIRAEARIQPKSIG
jgi:hypothetical protein